MKLFRSLLFIPFILSLCCQVVPPQAPIPPGVNPKAAMFDETVALVWENDKPFCAGVWIGEHVVLTADHCIADEPDVLHMRGRDGSHFAGFVALADPDRDLAALDVERPPEGHSVARLADSWYSGEPLDIIGFPNQEEWVYMKGYLQKASWESSVTTGADERLFFVQAPIWRGNSGGPAFGDDGRLLGICSALSLARPNLGFFVSLPEISAFLTGK